MEVIEEGILLTLAKRSAEVRVLQRALSFYLSMAAVTLAFFLVVCYPLQLFRKLIFDS